MNIVKLVHEVLSREQRSLPNGTGWNIRNYEEKWIQYLVFRRLLREKGFRVEAEHYGSGAFVDLLAKGDKTTTVALEIKGPSTVKTVGDQKKLNDKIRRDARKLRKIRSLPTHSRWVLALAYGTEDQVRQWLVKTQGLRRQLSGRKQVVTDSNLERIRLDRGKVLGLAFFNVG